MLPVCQHDASAHPPATGGDVSRTMHHQGTTLYRCLVFLPSLAVPDLFSFLHETHRNTHLHTRTGTPPRMHVQEFFMLAFTLTEASLCSLSL